jgi:hypothetical protein
MCIECSIYLSVDCPRFESKKVGVVKYSAPGPSANLAAKHFHISHMQAFKTVSITSEESELLRAEGVALPTMHLVRTHVAIRLPYIRITSQPSTTAYSTSSIAETYSGFGTTPRRETVSRIPSASSMSPSLIDAGG